MENAITMDLETRIERVDDQMTQAALYAQYWMAQATTGAATTRMIRKGGSDGPFMIAEELTAEALMNAHTHIRRHVDLSESKLELRQELATVKQALMRSQRLAQSPLIPGSHRD